MTIKSVVLGLGLLGISSVVFAVVYDTPEPESADQLVNYDDPDQMNVYRGGQADVAMVDPWAVPDPNTDDAQILEDQMSPDPQVEYDQQLYD